MKGYQEFPRVVYGPNGATKTIHSEDERPDGFFNTEAEANGEWEDGGRAAASMAAAAEKARDDAKAALDSEGVKYAKNAHTETLEKRVVEVESEKQEMRALLDEHDVIYDGEANHASLVELTEKLKAHLDSAD